MKAFGERIAGVEDDVRTVKADVAELKAFRDNVKGGAFDDIRKEIEGFGAKPAAADPAPTPDNHPAPAMTAAGLPAAGPLPTAA